MSNIILGLDPGIADTGYGIISVNNGKLSCLDFGSIKTLPGQDFSDRLEILDRGLQKIIDKHKPNLAVIEKIFFNTNAKTALIVGQARGVILLNVKKNNIKMIELTPLQIKQGVCNFGRADKNQVKLMVKLILNLKKDIKSDDSADALAAAICASALKI